MIIIIRIVIIMIIIMITMIIIKIWSWWPGHWWARPSVVSLARSLLCFSLASPHPCKPRHPPSSLVSRWLMRKNFLRFHILSITIIADRFAVRLSPSERRSPASISDLIFRLIAPWIPYNHCWSPRAASSKCATTGRLNFVSWSTYSPSSFSC